SAGNSGIEIELARVPRREAQMQPWEVMISESQERMLVCVKKGKEKQIKRIFSKWDLHAVVIGKVIKKGIVRIRNRGKVVAQIKAHALTEAPIYEMPYKKPAYLEKINNLDLERLPEPKDYNKVLLKLLASASIASKAWVYEQYDHMVQTNTVNLPGSDASVLRIKGTNKAIAATTDCNSRYCYLNPHKGAQIAVAEAARNLVCSGAEPAAVTDCLNFGNPEKPDRFWQFKNCVEGLAKACKFFKIPVVSGNVSFYNESPKGAINPTPTIGMIGIVENIKHACTQYFKRSGEAVILLGISQGELGGSEYLKQVHNKVRGDAPELDLNLERAVQRAALKAIKKGLVSSAHDCSEGGLVVALAECCITNKENMIGAIIEGLNFDVRGDAVLFGESQSRIILSCPSEAVSKIRAIAVKCKAPFQVIGTTGGEELKILDGKKAVVSLSLKRCFEKWANSLQSLITA
ncbi:MAG: AIR synthase related protein, partial [Omnitrophica bacterium]|nr:AIR synthase related protein [Candidatus Omnitrophota bacterium]